MADDAPPQSPDDEDYADRSLLNVAKAVWQARWLVLACLLAGAVLGVWYESGQPRFRTTTTIRWLSPNISYLYNGYWDIIGKIRAGQLKAIIDSHPQAARTSLRTDKDFWIARLEVLHDTPGEGRTVSEEILRKLRQLDADTAAVAHAPEGNNAPLQKLRQTLTELESLLANLPAELSGPQPVLPDDPITRLNQQFTSEAGPRLPLENLPLFPWYRSLQVRTSRILAANAAAGTAIPAGPLERLTALQQLSTEQLLECWWSFDVLVSSGPLPGFQVETTSEQSLVHQLRTLKFAAMGLWIGGLAGVIVTVPIRWLRLHWRQIILADEVPNHRSFDQTH